MNKLVSLLDSMKTMIVLMLIYAFAIGYATIIENDYGTITAKADIFNARWFEVLHLLLAINLVLNIFKYKMFSLEKAPIFIFHFSFIIILVGAAITRYVGYEGTLHIRENTAASVMTSSDNFFILKAKVGENELIDEQKVYFSKRLGNSLSASLNIDSKQVDVELLQYTPDVVEQMVSDPNGKAIVNMMITDGGKGKKVIIKEGMFFDAGDVVINFGSSKQFTKDVISLYVEDSKLFMKHEMPLVYLKMDDRSEGQLESSQKRELEGRTLFTAGTASFVLRDFMPKASMKLVSNPNASPRRPGTDALKFKVSVDGVSEEVTIFGQAGVIGKESHNVVNGVDVHLSFGAKDIQLPFEIFLKDFQLDRYPGSMSPASYASEVILVDKEQGIEMPYRIFMNHILDHRGYRFFQASYDQDELGTVLSVNNDPGTLPTYIGYTLLGIGMFWSLFSRRHRFSKLAKKAKSAADEKNIAASFVVAFALAFGATPSEATELDPGLKTIISFDKTHAQNFGKLIVQDTAGRMKPMDTLTNEVLAKVYGSDSLPVGNYKLDANQVILGMMVKPAIYKNIKMIKTKNKEVNKIIGAREDAKYVSFSQFFEDPDGIRGYKLAQYVDTAIRKEAKYRDKLDKALISIDEKVNVTFMIFTGQLIRIWPKANDENNKWFPTIEALQSFDDAEGEEVRKRAVDYFTSIDGSVVDGNWKPSDETLHSIAEYQKTIGASVYPSDSRIAAEVFYNETKIFERIYPIYLLAGFILLIMSFVKILKPSFKIDIFAKITLGVLIVLFLAHTVGLINRWYVSGHSPWSNGYESMIYIGWATVLAGFIFSKRSPMTMASTGILTGLILFVAHLNWMNPQITTLVPVLNSYWLSIHVSMITASYGFLGLGALLGFIVLLLFILATPANEKHISLSIKELNAINEMSLMVGLVLLTIGNFLGGVWANESWGRYWGWDPKETWALVTIVIYAVVLHLRFVKSLYSNFNFAVVSLLSFTSVLMTYFGVNYYLAGLHSYAKGDPVPIPDFVPVTYTIIFLIVVLAFRKRKLA